MTKSTNLNPSTREAAGAVYADLVREAAGGDRDAMERLLMRAQEVAYRFSLSTREAAKVAGISEASVKTRLHRARVMLRQAMEGT